MISQVIQVMKVDQNAKKSPLSHQKNEMLIFGLHLTSDDWPSDPTKVDQNAKKVP